MQDVLESKDWASQVVLVVKNLFANAGDIRDVDLIPGLGRSLGKGHGNPVFLPRESHGQRSLAGYSPWGHKESDTTEQLSLSLSDTRNHPNLSYHNYSVGKISSTLPVLVHRCEYIK